MSLAWRREDMPTLFNAPVKLNETLTVSSGFIGNVSSVAAITVNSAATTYSLAVTKSITGGTAFRGITSISSGLAISSTISATAATSGACFQLSLGVTTVASHRPLQLSVNSVVNGTSFLIVTNEITADSQEVCWFIVN